MEATICFLGPSATMNDVIEWFNAWLPFQGSLHAFYVPLSIFNFGNFLHGAPKKCKKIAAQLPLYEHLCGSIFSQIFYRNHKFFCRQNGSPSVCDQFIRDAVLSDCSSLSSEPPARSPRSKEIHRGQFFRSVHHLTRRFWYDISGESY